MPNILLFDTNILVFSTFTDFVSSNVVLFGTHIAVYGTITDISEYYYNKLQRRNSGGKENLF